MHIVVIFPEIIGADGDGSYHSHPRSPVCNERKTVRTWDHLGSLGIRKMLRKLTFGCFACFMDVLWQFQFRIALPVTSRISWHGILWGSCICDDACECWLGYLYPCGTKSVVSRHVFWYDYIILFLRSEFQDARVRKCCVAGNLYSIEV